MDYLQNINYFKSMAAKTQAIIVKSTTKVSRPGVHSKTKTSKIKTSKIYKKKYKGQGK